MIIVAWNYRGLAHPLAIRRLWALMTTSKADILVLSEVMIREEALRYRLYQLYFYHFIYVPAGQLRGQSWKERLEAELGYSSKNQISCLIYSNLVGSLWALSAIYSSPTTRNRWAF